MLHVHQPLVSSHCEHLDRPRSYLAQNKAMATRPRLVWRQARKGPGPSPPGAVAPCHHQERLPSPPGASERQMLRGDSYTEGGPVDLVAPPPPPLPPIRGSATQQPLPDPAEMQRYWASRDSWDGRPVAVGSFQEAGPNAQSIAPYSARIHPHSAAYGTEPSLAGNRPALQSSRYAYHDTGSPSHSEGYIHYPGRYERQPHERSLSSMGQNGAEAVDRGSSSSPVTRYDPIADAYAVEANGGRYERRTSPAAHRYEPYPLKRASGSSHRHERADSRYEPFPLEKAGSAASRYDAAAGPLSRYGGYPIERIPNTTSRYEPPTPDNMVRAASSSSRYHAPTSEHTASALGRYTIQYPSSTPSRFLPLTREPSLESRSVANLESLSDGASSDKRDRSAPHPANGIAARRPLESDRAAPISPRVGPVVSTSMPVIAKSRPRSSTNSSALYNESVSNASDLDGDRTMATASDTDELLDPSEIAASLEGSQNVKESVDLQRSLRPRLNSREGVPACDECRRRKVKCDRQAPCARCTASGRVCETSDSLMRRGPLTRQQKEIFAMSGITYESHRERMRKKRLLITLTYSAAVGNLDAARQLKELQEQDRKERAVSSSGSDAHGVPSGMPAAGGLSAQSSADSSAEPFRPRALPSLGDEHAAARAFSDRKSN